MHIKNLGRQDYQLTWEQMIAFTQNRNAQSADELWIVEHPSVFTQGISGTKKHVLNASDIPIVQSDRGGQITYHGPGQLVIYCLFDLKRLGLGVKQTVGILEASVQELLSRYQIDTHLKDGAPGVYVNNQKISALGLKVKNGKTYHGLSLNIDMDLSPFSQINPCGYPGLEVTQMADLTDNVNFLTVANELCQILYNNVTRDWY